MSKSICIYHGGCDDGFAAAWALRTSMVPDTFEFHPGVYGNAPPDVSDRHVVLVDFSYKRPILTEMAKAAKSILILDHHKTAAEDLAGMPHPGTRDEWCFSKAPDGVAAIFDMTRSGSGIAWDFFHPYQARPAFINYVEDRDLWRKALPNGDEFTIALRSHPQDFETWDRLVAAGPAPLIEEGRAIQRYYRLRVEELKQSSYLAKIAWGHDTRDLTRSTIAIANAPYFAASEVAGELCAVDGAEFGASYFEVRPGQWQYSLRSRGDFDVSAVAKCFGGGGHKNASGFTMPWPVHEKLP
jgi:hypothetical protein